MGWGMAERRQHVDTEPQAKPDLPNFRAAPIEHFAEETCLRITRANEKSLMDRQTLSIMKACEAVGVSRRTIYNWIAAGKVEYVRTAGGSIRIFADTLWRDANASASAASGAAGSLGHA